MDEPAADEDAAFSHGVLCAAVDNSRGEVGVAVLDMQHGTLRLHQVIEAHACCSTSLSLLEAVQPRLVVVCAPASTRGKTSFAELAAARFRGVYRAPRGEFNDTTGEVMVRQLARPADKQGIDRRRIYLALAAACALLRHAADSLVLSLVPNTLAVSTETVAAHVQVDAATVAALEIVAGEGALVKLFKPSTAGGKLLLRTVLLQPLVRRRARAEPRNSRLTRSLAAQPADAQRAAGRPGGDAQQRVYLPLAWRHAAQAERAWTAGTLLHHLRKKGGRRSI
jgi:DNA mismatch repair ATPase MutS